MTVDWNSIFIVGLFLFIIIALLFVICWPKKFKKIETDLKEYIDNKIKYVERNKIELENILKTYSYNEERIEGLKQEIKKVNDGILYLEKKLGGNASMERIAAIEKSIDKFDKFEEQIEMVKNKLDIVIRADIYILKTFQSVTRLFLLPVNQLLANVANSIPITKDDIEWLHYIFPIIRDSSNEFNIKDDNLIFMKELLNLASKELSSKNTVIINDFNQIPNFDSKLNELRCCLGVFEMPCSNKISEVIHTLEK